MNVFDRLDAPTKTRIIEIWHTMEESAKTHFINQVAIALSIWGDDEKGKTMVVDVLSRLMEDRSETLADFGLYVEKLLETWKTRADKIRRTVVILEGYRIKNALPGEPHKDLF